LILAPWQETNLDWGLQIRVRTMKRNSFKPGRAIAPSGKSVLEGRISAAWSDAAIVMVDPDIVLEAESLIAHCEGCADYAYLEFDYLLDALTGCDSTRTEYLMPHTARCPDCLGVVTEKTRVITR
jgi:hypothetical protein